MFVRRKASSYAIIATILGSLLLSGSYGSELQAAKGQRLVLIGGGAAPEAAISRFYEWSKAPKPMILVITWATVEPDGPMVTLRERLRPYYPKPYDIDLIIQEAPRVDKMATEDGRKTFLSQLNEATGVFLSGGDQNNFMAVFSRAGNGPTSMDSILARLQERYREGLVIAGTSAGTASVSKVMITGDKNPSKLGGQGLGLLDNMITDTHFMVRERELRLRFLVQQKHVPFGLGIDEDRAVSIENGTELTVIGDEFLPKTKDVLVVGQSKGDEEPFRQELGRGDRFSFKNPE